jgi:Spy/CpxP family protein refolding chaperone
MASQNAWILAATLACAPTVMLAAPPTILEAAPLAHQKPAAKSAEQKGGEQRRPRFVKWWQEADHRAELGIGDQQSARIEQIFQEHLPAQRQRYRELEKLEPALAQLIKDGTADPAVILREVERVENLTAEVRTSRIITLYRMHRELTAAQRAKLEALNKRREDDHRKSDSGRRQ